MGICIAAVIVYAWMPSSVWSMPLQSSDAPAHYYFIEKLSEQGLGAAMHLWPHGGFYPPLFHMLASSIAAVASLFGAHISVYAAFSTAWLISSGMLFPLGMLLLASYFLHDLDLPIVARAALAIIVPVLSVSSACHPYTLLDAGPLIAYGFATSLLPYLMYASLRLIDAIMANPFNIKSLVIQLCVTAATGLVLMLAHPRIAFTYALLILPFIVLRLPWKFIISAFAVIVCGGGAFAAFMLITFKSERYLHPETWFHSHQPSKTLGQALLFVFQDGLEGWVGIVCCALLLICAAASVALTKQSARRNAIALIIALLLVALVYVLTVTFVGALPNIISAPWYRDENRIMTMIPLAIVPLLTYGIGTLLAGASQTLREAASSADHWAQSARARIIIGLAALCIALVAVTISAQYVNPARETVAAHVLEKTTIAESNGSEIRQLTQEKLTVLKSAVTRTGTDATIISDPMNGSMYATSLYDATMLYPIMNPQSSGQGHIFADVEQAFASGDSQRLLTTVCPINPKEPEYFLAMGGQADSLQSFPYKAQYDTFHDAATINGYVSNGTLTKVKDYSSVGADTKDWALYQFNCGD
ncbi:hypothetical protein F7D08_1688 [Bifidobacterium cebidarum]|uniref:Transmembrane protein alanine and leucine rich n=2 Tax=Bifidobacterium cebidarum TaxID=2650773 RepID=A0A6I1GDV7_9BIFI|nr:hypothetical protein F7D08_1688 [Bifidobacterium cebidarum]